MVKLLGCVLLAVGGGMLCVQRIAAQRQEIRLLRDIAAALESIEAAIRWQKLSIPRAIEQQKERKLCGEAFNSILCEMEIGTALHTAWQRTFRERVTEEMAEILCNMEWNGDETQITGNLNYAVQRLQVLASEKHARQPQREKLYIALSASGVGLLAIMLI